MRALVLSCCLLVACASDGDDIKILGEIGKDDLAVHFHVVENVPVLEMDGNRWTCIKASLLPEEKGDLSVSSTVKHPQRLPATFATSQQACLKQGGAYTRLDQLQHFIGRATGHEVQDRAATDMPDACSAFSVGKSCAGHEMPKDSPLASVITSWNSRFFDMKDPATRVHADHFHGRGSQENHQAMEVSLFLPPEGVRDRMTQRLLENREAFFGGSGAGKAGTTGASFIAGNVGFGNRGEGSDLMSLLFPGGAAAGPAGLCKQLRQMEPGEAHCDTHISEQECNSHPSDGCMWTQLGLMEDGSDTDVTGKAGDGRRQMQGEMVMTSQSNVSIAPDLQAYQQAMIDTITRRSDVRHLFGAPEDMDFHFQHRLWRFGPVFDAKAKGGIWHRDTCPFGINGATPPNAIMFTLVYILYTENLNLPTAGTRVRDPTTGDIFQLPCEAGKGNMIRSGEDDPRAFFHSGPMNIQKADPEKPAYRVMMQSKTVVMPKAGRKLTIPSTGDWQGLNIEMLDVGDKTAAETAKQHLADWLLKTSVSITYGVGESNALGSAAYPLNVQRAWSVTRDLFDFLGFESDGVLPPPDKVNTPVVMFGFHSHSYDVMKVLQKHNFRVSTTATDDMYKPLYTECQDCYANMHTLDIERVSAVEGLLLNEPFDTHLVIDAVPGAWAGSATGTYSADPTLMKYGALLEQVASRPQGQGRIATVTYLSQMTPRGDQKKLSLQAEDEWVKFGEKFNVRIVIMRVADRVYGRWNSAILQWTHPTKYFTKPYPCRVGTDTAKCSSEEPLTRIHAEDLAHIINRMLAMYDLVDLHGGDRSMAGTATMDASVARFPIGTILNIVDDGPPDNMKEAELWCGILLGKVDLRDLPDKISKGGPTFSSPPEGFDPTANAILKKKLGYDLKYPSYRHGAAHIFAGNESP